jgi:hypothetical protein
MAELLACTVCFGSSSSPMALGVNMGIYVMLGVTVGVLVAFASFFIYLIRRARSFADEPAAMPAGQSSQEGTARC